MTSSKRVVAGVMFDAEGYGYSREAWSRVFHQVAVAMEEAGLPSAYGDEWDVDGDGYLYRGDAKTVRKICKLLNRYPVNVAEIENAAEAR